MKIDEMAAGREMDRLVAETMGWTLDERRCPVCGWWLKERCEDGCVVGDCSQRPPPKIRYDERYAHYSTDIAAGWEVDNEGWHWNFYEGTRDLYAVLRVPRAFDPIFARVPWAEVDNDKARAYALCRCRAALKAVGLTETEEANDDQG